ncbi:MAG: hypothetical protein ACYSP9_04280 [Planctomycetota bacterium]
MPRDYAFLKLQDGGFLLYHDRGRIIIDVIKRAREFVFKARYDRLNRVGVARKHYNKLKGPRRTR